MISLNYRDTRPIYEQIKENFKRLIVTGAMASGDKLPSVRTLATQLSINPNTIQRAYNELESEGYTCSVPGKGSFVAPAEDAGEKRRTELRERFQTLAAELLFLGVEAETLAQWVQEAVGGQEKTTDSKRNALPADDGQDALTTDSRRNALTADSKQDALTAEKEAKEERT